MTDFAQRLQFLMQHYVLDAAELAERLQIQKSAVSHLLSGRNKPRFDILARFARAFPDLNLRWLLTGDGEPFSPTPPEAEQQPADLFSAAGLPIETPPEQKPEKEPPNPKPKKIDAPNVKTVAEQQPDLASKSPVSELMELIKIYPDGTFEVLRRRKGNS